jgi:hypothetical protein
MQFSFQERRVSRSEFHLGSEQARQGPTNLIWISRTS